MENPAGKQAAATWVVVGASRGIGLEFVKQLLETGHRVIGTVRDPSGAGELSRVIEAQDDPKNCTMEQCDVTSSESINNFAARMKVLMESGNQLDGIIMNAGVLKYPNRATELTYEDFTFHMTTNVIGPIICAQKLINLDPQHPPPKVVFISSDSGSAINFLGHEDGFAAYAASKAALNQTLRHMALELKRRGGKWSEICVLALHPGEVHTDMNSGSVPWDVGTLLETNESVKGMLQVIGEKNYNDSGTFWCWDGRTHPW
ncbi:related to protoporphyrinogen oxidase [Fusarium torulosum]|uniref:Related to protoporphyrinogen oxidase n=1 Tax=Fusarium torulosum TaxID=33205 RepID=A0AAE8M204_9HYPO|nr:related to protoporphyrinogen oxidase [Fusarium torulosum]